MEHPQYTEMPGKKVFSRIGIALSVILVLASALQFVWFQLLPRLGEGPLQFVESTFGMWLGTFLPLYLVAVPAGLLFLVRIPFAPFRQERLGAKNFLLFLLFCFPTMYAGNIIGTLLSLVLSSGTAENAITEYLFDPNPIKILVVAVLAPLIEEYIFRKQLIDRTAKYGEKTAVLLSALAFALFHGNLFQFFYAFGLGLIFGYVYLRTRRLLYPALMHGIINFFGGVLAPWVLSKVDLDLLGGGFEGAEALPSLLSLIPAAIYLSLMIGLSIAGVVLLIVQRRMFVFYPAPHELPKGDRLRTVYLNTGMTAYILICLFVIILSLRSSGGSTIGESMETIVTILRIQ